MKKYIYILLILSCLLVKAEEPEILLTAYNTASIDGFISPMEVEKDTAEILIKRAQLPATETLYIVIVSGGGDIDSAAQLSFLINNLPNVSLICKYCASAASAIFVGSKTPRLVIKKSNLLMHHMFNPKFTIKEAKNYKYIKEFIRVSDLFDSIYYSTMKISKKEYEKKIDNKDWTTDMKESLKNHLADKAVKLKCDKSVQHLFPDTCS